MKKNRPFVELDQVDLAMLELLQADGAISNAALGEKLSLSVTPCWRRRKRLQDEGVIVDYQANLNRRLLGLEVLAFVLIRFAVHTDDAPDKFERDMLLLPEVLSCHKITGDADYMLQILAADLDAYGDFVERVFRKQHGVTSIRSSLSLKEVKFSSRIPITRDVVA